MSDVKKSPSDTILTTHAPGGSTSHAMSTSDFLIDSDRRIIDETVLNETFP